MKNEKLTKAYEITVGVFYKLLILHQSILALIRINIDVQKNNFTLSDPLPQIPSLKGARVRLNSERIFAFICLKPKIFSTIL
ncbi:MAG: hypothetical protein DRR08_02305 [Candidatus Parabeggiatoa sp. nov. 2]|nr:MAG: hypothetical protein B6247_20860 [Beggiatoa sp. 4572_84]RKZ63850.1 MAG: hypothetical protein DRR08_02305 [Gammaproteobacteria bacterium]